MLFLLYHFQHYQIITIIITFIIIIVITIKNENNYERGHRRKNSNGSDDGTVPTNKHIQAKRYQHLHDETDVTPRSHHGNTTQAHSHTHSNTNTIQTSSLPPSKFSFDENNSSSSSSGRAGSSNQWQCENPKCRKYNTQDIDYCNHCAMRKGATGERGNNARINSASSSRGANDSNQWQCENPRCHQFNPLDINYCNNCAVKKGATGERGSGARLYAG